MHTFCIPLFSHTCTHKHVCHCAASSCLSKRIWLPGDHGGLEEALGVCEDPARLLMSAYCTGSCFLQSHHKGSGFSQWATRGFHWGKYTAALTSSPCQPWLLLGIWYCVWDLGCIQLDWNVFYFLSVWAKWHFKAEQLQSLTLWFPILHFKRN